MIARHAAALRRSAAVVVAALLIAMTVVMAAFTLTGQERFLALTPHELLEIESEEWWRERRQRG